MEPLLSRGVVIVAPDYQGLGGPGKHNYAQPISNGTDVINALRAARDFKPAAAGEKAVVYGWSQGGGATLGAASLKDYLQRGDGVAPVKILGFVAMARELSRIPILRCGPITWVQHRVAADHTENEDN